MEEFSRAGYEATTTEAIARRADISQAYVFRLFGSKHDLFVASVERCFEIVQGAFERAAETVPEGDLEGRLQAIGETYADLLRDRRMLVLQMHGYAAAIGDPVVQHASRRSFARLWASVARLSGASDEEMVSFFAHGMLMNVAAALELPDMCDAGGWPLAAVEETAR